MTMLVCLTAMICVYSFRRNMILQAASFSGAIMKKYRNNVYENTRGRISFENECVKVISSMASRAERG